MLTKDIEVLCNRGEPRFHLSVTTDRAENVLKHIARGSGVIVPTWKWTLWEAGVLKVPNGRVRTGPAGNWPNESIELLSAGDQLGLRLRAYITFALWFTFTNDLGDGELFANLASDAKHAGPISWRLSNITREPDAKPQP